MLKIKDNVDLKELEKFGFKQEENRYCGNRYIYTNYESSEMVCVSLKSKFIYCELEEVGIYGAIFEDLLGVLFDLMQAGLVEKV